jgi:hypothetical protein
LKEISGARQQAFCLMDFISAANLFVFRRAQKRHLLSGLDANGCTRLAHKSNNFYMSEMKTVCHFSYR